jgi:hypothetical protein
MCKFDDSLRIRETHAQRNGGRQHRKFKGWILSVNRSSQRPRIGVHSDAGFVTKRTISGDAGDSTGAGTEWVRVGQDGSGY